MTWRLAAPALLLLLFAEPATADAPEQSPQPPARAETGQADEPPENLPVDTGGPTPDTQESAPGDAQPADTDETPPEGQDLPARPTVPELLAETEAEFIQCLDDLREIGVVAEPADPVRSDDPACGIARPVNVSMAAPDVRLEPAAVMRCATARALGTWVRDFVVPAARLLPDRGELTAIDHGSAYVCRRRNGAADGKPSEHSFGNALDVMGFRFADGPPIPVEPREREGSFAEAFQDAARATACLSFTTVLGPGSDAAHADHLHLDVIERRGGFRLCQ